MIFLKSSEEIELLRISNQIVAKTHGEISKIIKPGITTKYIDKIADEFIRDNGAVPGFLNYNGFKGSICVSVNDVVVHGIPSDNIVLQEGDIVSVDIGAYKNGFHGDSAYTYPVGEVSPQVKALLRTTKEALYKGIEQARENNRVGDISAAVQSYCEERGYGVVREMIGHGLGRNLHEAPDVPNYGKRGNGPKLRAGMVICIEPMINLGVRNVMIEKDGWTCRTVDGKPSAHYEHAVAIGKGQADILSGFKYIEEVLGERFI
ncbi:MAG: type I methionyl aminopeptidase [Prevotellaceae bacterium]|jgi:methionyl aminopeptidase|nr:type I methionyl aminopeptidase [Prevotellaceae bacterium]